MFLAVPLVGCRVNAQAIVSVRGSGSGTIAVAVALDQQAAARIGNVANSLRVADLQRLGWVLDPASTAPDGSVTATLHHDFADPVQGEALLGSLGPVHLTVTRHGGFVSSRVGVSGSVDLRNGVDAFGDDALSRALGVSSIATALAGLQQGGAVVPDVNVSVVAHLPGRPGHVVGGGRSQGDTVTWTVPLGQEVLLGATSSGRDAVAQEWLIAAVGLFVAAILTSVVQVRRQLGRRRHRDRWTLSRP